MMGLLLLAFGLAGQWMLGYAIAHWLTTHSGTADCPASSCLSRQAERTGLGFVLGTGFTAGSLFLWSLLGGPLGREASLVISGTGCVLGGLAIRRERIPFRKIDPTNLPRQTNPMAIQDRAWIRLCQILIACLFVFTVAQTLMTPQHLWDERASFAIKGVLLFMDRTIDSRDLADPNYVQFHPRYPLMVPLAEHHIYCLLGLVDDRLAKLVFPQLYLGLVLTMAGGLSRQLSEASAWFFALLAATMPVLVPWEYGFPCGQADASMACFHGLSCLYFWNSWKLAADDRFQGGVQCSILAGLCGAMAAFTKDEGIAFLMVDVVSVFLVLLLSRQIQYGLRILLTAFTVAGLILLPWILHRQRLPLTTEANYFGRVTIATLVDRRANLAWEIPHLTRRMFWEFRDWGLQWWLMLMSGLASPRRAMCQGQLFLLLDVLGSLLSLLLAGMVAETEVSEHIGGSSHRYLMQLAPVAILFAAGQLGFPRRCPPDPLKNH